MRQKRGNLRPAKSVKKINDPCIFKRTKVQKFKDGNYRYRVNVKITLSQLTHRKPKRKTVGKN